MKKIHFAVLLIGLLFCNGCTDHRYTWVAIGSSITWQDGHFYKHGPDKWTIARGYQSVIADQYHHNIKLDNEGYRGYSLGGKNKSVYPEVINKDYSNVDLVTIFCGTNDLRLDVPIGNESSGHEYFYGALTRLISKIKGDNSNVKIVLLTPIQRNNDGYTAENRNKVGYNLIDYINAIKEIGAKNKLQVVDLFSKSGITPNNLKQYTYDGLHPFNPGYKRIADVLLKEVFVGIDLNRNYH